MVRAGLRSIGALGKQQKWGPPLQPQAYLLRGPSPEGAPSSQNLLCKVIFWCFESVCKSNTGPKHIRTPWARATQVTPVKLVIQHWNHLSIKTNSTSPIGSLNVFLSQKVKFLYAVDFFFAFWGSPFWRGPKARAYIAYQVDNRALIQTS